MRVPFSSIYSFLRENPAHGIRHLESATSLDEKVRNALKAKLYLMYAQNYTQIGLLKGYKNEVQRLCQLQKQESTCLNYAGC